MKLSKLIKKMTCKHKKVAWYTVPPSHSDPQVIEYFYCKDCGTLLWTKEKIKYTSGYLKEERNGKIQ